MARASATKTAATPSMTHKLSRPPLRRMLRIHEELRARRRPLPNCTALAETLEVSTKTVQRDIDFMRDQLDLPIEYDQVEHGYYYTMPVDNFPTLQVTEGELVALYVAEKALAQYRGSPFEKSLRGAFRKLTEGMQDRVRFSWSDLDDRFSFRGIGTTVADLKQFETISNAVLNTRGLEFEYRGLNDKTHKPRRVQPYHVACIENQWYLFAFDLDRQQMRTFVLSRMRRSRSTGKKFKRGPFSLEMHLSQALGVFTTGGGGQPKEVRIRFDAFAARLVRERRWHPSQKIKELAHDELELTMKLGSFPEVFRWILSWGEHARVLAPASLRDEVRRSAQQIASFYDR